MNRGRRRATNHLLTILRVLALALWSLKICVLYLCRRLTLGSRAERLRRTPDWVQFWGRWAAWLAGVEVRCATPLPPRGVLLCPNHLGYVDVLALAATLPCFFVSRADAASWPLIGFLIRASEQVLVSRRRARDLVESSRLLAERLGLGQSVCLFLEGTSTGGDHLLRFLPTLLQPAIEVRAEAVPVGMRWDAPSAGMTVSDDVAYWGDHQFLPHVWRLMGVPGCRVTIFFGSPVPTRGRDRKELAEDLQQRVQQLVFGRP